MPYRFVEHVGEVELELEAATEAGVFEAALAAFAELSGDGGQGEAAVHEIDLEAADRPLLLADWLNELVFLAEAERFVPERVERLELDETHLRATVAGRHGSPSPLVKAVTLNRLAFTHEGGRWHGRVVVDV